jgi:hypothetical protein
MTVAMTTDLRARRHVITWSVRVRRPHEEEWTKARAVNLSVTGILLKAAGPYDLGENLEVEIDCFVRPEINTLVRAAGEVIRIERPRRGQPRVAIQFDNEGASIFADAPHESNPDPKSNE